MAHSPVGHLYDSLLLKKPSTTTKFSSNNHQSQKEMDSGTDSTRSLLLTPISHIISWEVKLKEPPEEAFLSILHILPCSSSVTITHCYST
jgi:hypothetical protein